MLAWDNYHLDFSFQQLKRRRPETVIHVTTTYANFKMNYILAWLGLDWVYRSGDVCCVFRIITGS